MIDFLQLCFAGVALGAQYALVALGFVIIYRATGVINFAQGSFMVFGAYLAYNYHVTWGIPFYIALVMAMISGFILGSIVDRVVMQRMVGQPVFATTMITIGILFVLDQVATSIWGFDNLNLGDPWGIRTVTAGDLVFAVKDLWTIGLTAAVVVAFFLFFRFSKMGVAMRATALDQEAALAQGISSKRVYMVSWGIAGVVGALAGVTLAAGPSQLAPALGLIALQAFPAMILGGLESPGGAVLGGIIIGLAQTLTAGYQPEYAAWLGDNFQIVMPYLVMIVILMVRPYGLFGTKEVHRV